MDQKLDSCAAMATAARALELNELRKLYSEEIESFGRDFDLRLHSARPRHHHVLDLIRAALSTGTTVTAEGFLDQVGDSFGLLRWPRLNFLPVPEDVCVPHAIIQQFKLRPAQQLAGTLRLPRDREKSLMVDQAAANGGAPGRHRTVP